MNLKRLLIVAEPGKDGVFDYVCALIEALYREHPTIVVDLAYSSLRSGAGLVKLVAEVKGRGGEALDMRIGNMPGPSDVVVGLKLIALARRRRIQLIHAHSSKAGGLCRVLRRLVPGFPPVVYTPHAYFGLDGRQDFKALFFNRIERFLGQKEIAIADSPDERAFALDILRVPPRRIIPIYLGVDTKRFRPPTPEERAAARIEFGFPEGVPVLVTVGRESHQKNYPALYRGLNDVLSDPGVNLFMFHAGAGGEALAKKWLSPEARKKHRAVEFVSAIERVLWAADGFILASRYEGLSLAVVSALCCGPKILLSRVPGNKCLARLGFREIAWLDPAGKVGKRGKVDPGSELDPFGPVFEARIDAAVREWLGGPVPLTASPGQALRAHAAFNSHVQMKKVFRLYRRFAEPLPKAEALKLEPARLERLLVVAEPGKDGAFEHVKGLIDHLHASHPEIRVDYAYSSLRDCPDLHLLADRVRARGGEAIDLRIGNAPKPRDFVAAWRIASLARRRRPQLIHAHSSKAGALCRLLWRLVPGFPPVVYTPHAYYVLDGKHTPMARIFGAVERLLGKRGVAVITSPDERDFAVGKLGTPPARALTNLQCIDTDRFRPPVPGERAAARAEFGIPEGARLLVTVGRASAQKNYAPLYRALDPLLAEPGTDLFFYHAGVGGAALAEEWLSPEARRRFGAVEFTPAVERLLRGADGFILMSLYETLSLAVVSAVCTGLKMFLSRVMGNKCLDGLGFHEITWVDLDQHEGPEVEGRITEAVRGWLRHPIPVSPGQAELARRSFNVTLQMEKVVGIYERLLRHPELHDAS